MCYKWYISNCYRRYIYSAIIIRRTITSSNNTIFLKNSFIIL